VDDNSVSLAKDSEYSESESTALEEDIEFGTEVPPLPEELIAELEFIPEGLSDDDGSVYCDDDGEAHDARPEPASNPSPDAPSFTSFGSDRPKAALLISAPPPSSIVPLVPVPIGVSVHNVEPNSTIDDPPAAKSAEKDSRDSDTTPSLSIEAELITTGSGDEFNSDGSSDSPLVSSESFDND
jgi:hypothetical protein